MSIGGKTIRNLTITSLFYCSGRPKQSGKTSFSNNMYKLKFTQQQPLYNSLNLQILACPK